MELKNSPSASDRIGELEREVRALSLRLETSRRRVRRASAVAACLLAVTVFAGATLAEKFSRVEVLGPKNDLRVSIEVNPADSGTGIYLLDTKGTRRLLMGVDPTGSPEILFFGPTGQLVKAVRP